MTRAVLLLVLCAAWLPAAAQSQLTNTQMVAAATRALPDEYREGAEVRKWSEDGPETIRFGSNGMICLADDPSDDRFHVACYQESLEPFMARGRELREMGLDRDSLQAVRESEAASGKIKMPDHPAALYSLSGPADSFNPETEEVVGANPLYVVYIPYATAESTGLPTQAPRGQPWIMNPGKPWAHIMLIPPAPDEDN
ncbi:MAG: hypothetical protein WD275_03105 [Rhodothermales bacterium]